jgi:hypothetical protein
VEQLAREAQHLRHSAPGSLRGGSQYGGLQKIVVFLLMAVSLAGAIFLVVSEHNRRLLIDRLGAEWARLYQSEEARGVFELPAPPPRRVEPRVVFRTSGPVVEPDGTVYTATPDESGGETIEKAFIPPQKTPGFEAAFRLLAAESAAASKLINGELPGLRYKEWQPIQNKHPEYYVSLLAEQTSDQTEVQLIWSVNTESGRIAPLSQAARDLERTS